MNYVGIDIGSTASKVVALGDKNIEFVLPTGWSSKETVDEIKNRLLSYEIDVCDDNTKVVATGYGRISVDFADKIITDNLSWKRWYRNCKRRLYYNRYWWTRYKSYNCRK